MSNLLAELDKISQEWYNTNYNDLPYLYPDTAEEDKFLRNELVWSEYCIRKDYQHMKKLINS